MLTRDEIEKMIFATVAKAGFKIFDLHIPISKKGAVRIFLNSLDKSPIKHDDCAKVSKALFEIEDLNWMFEKYSLEVSSPGLNRALKTSEHYEGAIGERIKFVVSSGEKTDTYFGTLSKIENGEIFIFVEGLNEERLFKLLEVKKANVETNLDFNKEL